MHQGQTFPFFVPCQPPNLFLLPFCLLGEAGKLPRVRPASFRPAAGTAALHAHTKRSCHGATAQTPGRGRPLGEKGLSWNNPKCGKLAMSKI